MVTLFSAYAAERDPEVGGYTIGHITIGDDYDKKINEKKVSPIEHPNPWAATNPLKKGKHPRVCFDWRLRGEKYLSLSEGDKYVDPGAHEKAVRLEQAKKQQQVHSGAPFKNPGPAKKAVGLGNYYGCFNEKNKEDECRGFRHETEYDVIKKGELPAKREPRMANIKTAPTRSGTYGCPGVLLSDMHAPNAAEIEPWTGLEYICDPYDREHKMEIEKQKKERELLSQMPAPWRSQQRIKGLCFDAPKDSRSTGASQVYRLTQPLAPRRPEKEVDRKHAEHSQPFRPPHQGRSGLNGFFGEPGGSEGPVKFPEYREDPYEMKEENERKERKKNMPAFGPWKPVSQSKSLQVKSIEFGRGF